jgi:hypothetical protein
MKIDNSSFERAEEFKYLGTTLTSGYSIQEEVKSRLKSGNACYHSVQSLLSSSLLSKKLKIKIYRTIILPVVLYGCETWSLTLREERRLRQGGRVTLVPRCTGSNKKTLVLTHLQFPDLGSNGGPPDGARAVHHGMDELLVQQNSIPDGETTSPV